VQIILAARQFDVRPAQIDFTGNNLQTFERSGFDFIGQVPVTEERAISAGARGFFEAQAAGGVGLRVEVEKQYAAADSGQARRHIYRGGGFADAALLIGDRNDFGWHPPDLMPSAAAFQACCEPGGTRNA